MPKKRVRREAREIKCLRDQTRELELRLEQLKKRQSSGCDLSPVDRPNVIDATWRKKAEQQLKKRLESEQLQEDLEGISSVQKTLVVALKKHLKACSSDKKLPFLLKPKVAKFWNLFSGDDSGIYAEQLTQVAKMYLKMQQPNFHSRMGLQMSTGVTQGREVMKADSVNSSDVTFEMHCGTSIPFDVHVAGNAYWRLMTSEPYIRHGTLQTDLHTQNNFAASFTWSVELENSTATVCGKQTSRRYINDNSEVIMLVNWINPVEVNGTRFFGMQCRRTSWVKLRRLAGGNTFVEMYSETTPLFLKGIEDVMKQIQAFFDSMASAHSTTDAIYCHMVRELLLQEDWKATYGSDE
ncbi:hypothetical protein P3T76_008001 [Phytophthora citrophthora]|uniref:M96 mating-specific protein family n=1 Tax=Phytophthora citrophthora TaxID=4793 RepID=A0AAD9LL83_9STRA|nr:hypothetical protein P3T76_008001 [Phytophthora citrophthora]